MVLSPLNECHCAFLLLRKPERFLRFLEQKGARPLLFPCLQSIAVVQPVPFAFLRFGGQRARPSAWSLQICRDRYSVCTRVKCPSVKLMQGCLHPYSRPGNVDLPLMQPCIAQSGRTILGWLALKRRSRHTALRKFDIRKICWSTMSMVLNVQSAQ